MKAFPPQVNEHSLIPMNDSLFSFFDFRKISDLATQERKLFSKWSISIWFYFSLFESVLKLSEDR
jgi:hypothetical protein